MAAHVEKETGTKRVAFLRSLLGGHMLVEPKTEGFVAWGREKGLVRTFRAGEFVGVTLTTVGRARATSR